LSDAGVQRPKTKAFYPNNRLRVLAGLVEWFSAGREWLLIRPISARYMHAKEVASYEKENPQL
jgi:uncharacterized DUF497 family protein